MEIKFFNTDIEEFINKLDAQTTAKTLRTLDLLETFSNKLGMPHSKKIETHLYELRIRGTKEVRIIYCFHKNAIILLHAFIKKTQKLPQRTIELAKNRLNSLD